MKQLLKKKLDRLDIEREEMYESIAHLSEKDLHNNVYGWSIIQVFSHLNDSELGTIAYMKKKMQAGDNMKDYSFRDKLRVLLSKAFLQSSIKWKAPKYISSPEGKYSLSEMKEMWAETRKKTKAYVDEYPKNLMNKAVFKHPLAGRINITNAIDSMTYHQRHHRYQIKRIKKKIGG